MVNQGIVPDSAGDGGIPVVYVVADLPGQLLIKVVF
jgi:hypothetical protein